MAGTAAVTGSGSSNLSSPGIDPVTFSSSAPKGSMGSTGSAGSSNGGTEWGPSRLHPDLVTPVCMSALYTHKSGALLFSGPYSETSRVNLTVLASLDNGVSFTRSLTITEGPSGYSALQCGLLGRLDCAILYDAMRGGGLMFSRFAFEDIKPFKTDDVATRPVVAGSALSAGTASCSRYDLVHSGCTAVPGPPTFCGGNASQLYDGATILPNGTHINGKRFAWESTSITKRLVSVGEPMVDCARLCAQQGTCVGFAMECSPNCQAKSKTSATCYTVNSLKLTLTVLVGCPSYKYTRNPGCKPACGAGSDALRLPAMPALSLYQPRPAVSASSGGVAQCAALCDRLPGCVGFSIDNQSSTLEALCSPTNFTTGPPAPVYAPVLSYARANQHAVDNSGACTAALQAFCPQHVTTRTGHGLKICDICVGNHQAVLREAECTAAEVHEWCATTTPSIDWWVVPPDQVRTLWCSN